MDIKEMEFGNVNWIHWAQERVQWQALVNTVTNLWVPQKVGNFLTRWATISFLRTLINGFSYLDMFQHMEQVQISKKQLLHCVTSLHTKWHRLMQAVWIKKQRKRNHIKFTCPNTHLTSHSAFLENMTAALLVKKSPIVICMGPESLLPYSHGYIIQKYSQLQCAVYNMHV
jgi:hypothetical protein